MPDNDFWIGQEQIPVDLSLLLTYHNDEDYWYVPGEYALRVYTVDTLNTNFARPCFAFGERTSDPEMEDVSGAIENTLHELLDSGATPEDVYRIMGLVKESELSPETKEADSYLPIDLGYCIDGNIVSYEAVPEGVATVPENVDYPRYAEAMESHVPLPIATQIAKHDFSHGQADILMEAARSPHVSHETLETIADKTLSSGKMRGLLDIASVGKNPLDFRNGRADAQGGCFRAVPRRQRPPRDGAWPCAAAFGRPRADGRGFPRRSHACSREVCIRRAGSACRISRIRSPRREGRSHRTR